MSYRQRRPPHNDDSSLARPFKIPMITSRNAVRSVRKIVNYAESAEGELPENKENSRIGTHLGMTFASGARPVSVEKGFVTPLKARQNEPFEPPALGLTRQIDFVPRPLHDPCGEFAIVLYDPTTDNPEANEARDAASELASQLDLQPVAPKRNAPPTLAEILGIQTKEEREKQKKKVHEKVPVVIDPKLARILRPHQVDGVKFLYRCTTGLIDQKAFGCIMADEMGLGKTLQCIALMWTLLKQSPEGGKKGTIEKAIIVCPSSLVRNWANELVKWLGPDTLPALAMDGKQVKSNEITSSLSQWAEASGRQIIRPVLIISYETLRRNVDAISNAEIGLVLADEGHRLKNGDSLTFTALDALNAKRRVILSGTPIQNDLSEYFSLISFANPGLLGDRLAFKKTYENKILKARDAGASDKEIEEGTATLRKLLEIVNRFIIRRTNDILSKYLPVKFEHVVFCKLSPFQERLYSHFTQTILPSLEKADRGQQTLNSINTLKKICNHPDLVDLAKDIKGASRVLPPDYAPPDGRGRERDIHPEYSGKFMVLERMLHKIRTETNDKIVLISNYTSTLDLIQNMCRHRRYGCLRLDGTMAINKRQKLVDQFNNPDKPEFIFLLSSKAGGCGINLIGANRLILLDPDWNPAADQQALARVWRDGQKKDCFVYRFIATGTIEEKIYQRQTMKQTLSSAVVDENADAERLFTYEDLRRLFQYNKDTNCETHETFNCRRCSKDKQTVGAPAHLYGAATTWDHIHPAGLGSVPDKLLQQESNENVVSFVFQYISH